MKRFLNVFSSILISLAVMSSATALVSVTINGPSCENTYSDYCGWGGFGGYYPSPDLPILGEGGGSVEPPTSPPKDETFNSRTMNYNRQPECLREQVWMRDAIEGVLETIAATGGPLGAYLPLEIGDPLYTGGDWSKYEVDGYFEQIFNDQPGFKWVTRYRMHYMFNRVTKQIAQTKLKNSKVSGCDGIRETNGSSYNGS